MAARSPRIDLVAPAPASTHLRISAGITWLVSRSKLSPGPYRLTGSR